MALVLTCACGARFELEDALAGEQVPCPDCQVLVKAPDVPTPQPRTSYWALASAVLALTGAFTVVGTVAAVGCGIVALVRILRQPDRVRGLGFALFGVIAGLLLTATTVFALSRGLFVTWGDQMRETLLADQIDITGPLLINEPTKTYTLTRPNKLWGKRLDTDKTNDPLLLAINRTKVDLAIVQPSRAATVDVRVVTDQKKLQSKKLLAAIVQGYADSNPEVRFPYVKNDEDIPWGNPLGRLNIEMVGNGNKSDSQADFIAEANHRRWRIVLRLCNRNGKDYLVRGYMPENQSPRAWSEIMEAIDSFKSKE